MRFSSSLRQTLFIVFVALARAAAVQFCTAARAPQGISEYFPTDRPSAPRPLSSEKGCPTDRPSRPLATPRDPTRVTRPTDSPPPLSPQPGWVGPPDRPTLSELRSHLGTQSVFNVALPALRRVRSRFNVELFH